MHDMLNSISLYITKLKDKNNYKIIIEIKLIKNYKRKKLKS